MSPEQQQVRPSAEGELGPGRSDSGFDRELAFSTDREVPRKGTVAFKFGGSSLDGAKRLLHAATLVRDAAERASVTAVVSAMKGVTDRLLDVAHQLAEGRNQSARTEAEALVELHLAALGRLNLVPADQRRVAHELNLLRTDLFQEIPPRGRALVSAALFDRLASFGERFSARLFAAALVVTGVPAVPVCSSDFVLTSDNFREARPRLEHTRQRGRHILLPLLAAGIVPVVTGFIGATPDGRITTLGRNSSDFSAALVAHVVNAEELVIWTDVDGIYTANPRESKQARLLEALSYDEAYALAASGAKVLHPLVLPLAAETKMTVWVRNSFKPQLRGTRIGPQPTGGAS